MAEPVDPARSVRGDANIGNARTEQLFDELQARIEMTTGRPFPRSEAAALLTQLRNTMHNVLDFTPGAHD